MVLKKADSLILRGFIGPYIVSFFIVEFVLIMMFMWKWIDDLLGRGFAMTDYLELIVLFGITMISLSLPLTVLLSSVMVYGDMEEHFELSSLKSSGLSLVRIFRPALWVAIATALLSIVSSNYFKPMASKAFLKKFNNMRLSKVTFALEDKVFNLDFKDRAIYAEKRSKDGKNLENLMIYYTDQKNKSLLDVTVAQKATMQVSESGKYMVMDLFDGWQYREVPLFNSKNNYITKPDRILPLDHATFSKQRIVFELSDIFKDMSNLNLERKKFDMLNSFEMLDEVDTLNRQMNDKLINNLYGYAHVITLPTDSSKNIATQKNSILGETIKHKLREKDLQLRKTRKEVKPPNSEYSAVLSGILNDFFTSPQQAGSLATYIPANNREKVLNGAKSKNSALKTRTWNNFVQNRNLDKNKQKYLMKFHQQFCWAVICILLLFIGGPMGTLVKKGGFGYPMLIAIGFYMLFMILKILGERLAHSGAVSGAVAGWLPFVILSPFAFLVTYFALMDIQVNFSFLGKILPKWMKPSSDVS